MDQYNKIREKRKTKTKDAAVGFASWPLEINTGILTWHGKIFFDHFDKCNLFQQQLKNNCCQLFSNLVISHCKCKLVTNTG